MVVYISPAARESAIGRGGDPYGDFPRLCPGARIVVVGGMGIMTPYEVLSNPEKRNGVWQLRLRPVLDGHPEETWQSDHGYHGLSHLGILPHYGSLPRWDQSIWTFDLADFVNFCKTEKIGLLGLSPQDVMYLGRRLEAILAM